MSIAQSQKEYIDQAIPKKKYLTLLKRQRDVSFRFTERDFEVIEWVNKCGYLLVWMIKFLVFPNTSDNQVCRRRLKYLYHAGYLSRVQAVLPKGRGAGEMAYCLGNKSVELLEAEGIQVLSYSRNSRLKHAFLNHALSVALFRIYLELGLKEMPQVNLRRVIMDFEIKSFPLEKGGKKEYRLFNKLIHPNNKKPYICYPDIFFILEGTGKYKDMKMGYCVECDRGSMSLKRIIREKITGYDLFKSTGKYTKWAIENFMVLFVTSSEKRVMNLRDEMVGQAGSEFTWITDHTKVNPKSIFNEPIWLDHRYNMRSILKN